MAMQGWISLNKSGALEKMAMVGCQILKVSSPSLQIYIWMEPPR